MCDLKKTLYLLIIIVIISVLLYSGGMVKIAQDHITHLVSLNSRETTVKTQSNSTTLALLYPTRTTLKAQNNNNSLLFKMNQLPMVSSYCNNKTRPKGREYVLSYAVFGKNSWEKYGKHVKYMADIAAKSSFYREWTVRLYHDSYPVEVQNNLMKLYENLEFCDIKRLVLPFAPNLKVSDVNGMTWRFIPMADPTVYIMCSRDLDVDIYKREEDAVQDWIRTNKTLHSMRDHPDHGALVLGGMWCYRTANSITKGARVLDLILKNAAKRSSTSEARKGDDQFMLSRYLWPELSNDVIQHDSYLCRRYGGSIPFPSQRSAINEIIGLTNRSGIEARICPTECRPKDHQDWLYC